MKDNGRHVGATVPVWDRLVRLLHWTLVLCVLLAWLSTFANLLPVFAGWHQPVGYVALAVVLLRLLWGVVARGRYARLAQFVRAPRPAWVYLRLLLQRREPRYVGHNPLGGWMVLALIACVLGLALSGWLYTSDRFWGDETVELVHTWLAWGMLGLIVLHVVGVLFTSLRHRENLVRAMFDGRKPAPGPHDVR